MADYLGIARKVDGVLRHYWGKPKSEEAAERAIRRLAARLRWAIRKDWPSSEIINWVKLTTFTNCVAWSPAQIASGKPMVYRNHQRQVADVVKQGLIELGKKDAERYLGC
jgi:hypothetical protein